MGLIICTRLKFYYQDRSNFFCMYLTLTLVLFKLGGGGWCPGILTQIQGLLSTCPGIGPLWVGKYDPGRALLYSTHISPV